MNDYPLCGGFYQSPIALDSAAHYEGQPTNPEKLGYIDYDVVPENTLVQNNGAGCEAPPCLRNTLAHRRTDDLSTSV